MQEIWLLTDLQWIRHSCSMRGGWGKRTKGLQRFNMLSFLAKAWDVKLLVFLLCSFILALAMHHIELTKAEPVTFFSVRKRMHAWKTSSYLHRFFSTFHHHRVCERFTSILGRLAVAHHCEGWKQARVKVIPIWGNWAGGLAGGWAMVAFGVDGKWGAGAQVLYDLEACGPGLNV